MSRFREFADFRLRVNAVAAKEAGTLLRQPRLLAVLLAGPVLIMVIFALSFNFHFSKPSVAVVVEPGSPGAKLFSRYENRFRSQVNIEQVTSNKARAENLLRSGEIDGVVVVPSRPLSTIESGRQARINVLYRSQNVLFGYVVPNRTGQLVQSLNQLFLTKGISQELQALRSSNDELGKLKDQLGEAQNAEQTLASPQARKTTTQLASTLNGLENTLSAFENFAPDGLHTRVSNALTQVRNAEKLLSKVQALQQQAQNLKQNGGLEKLQKQVSALQQEVSKIPRVSTKLLVTPFKLNLQNVARFQPTIVQYYAPGVLSLLVQHMALSLASLAIVREYLGGTKELFEVSPLRDVELLLGKFVAYVLSVLLTNAVVAAALIWYLNLPVDAAALESLGASMVLVALSSVALGFLLSVLVRREIQAVEVSMLVLIASVFFAGFIFPSSWLNEPAKGLSYILPSTYGIDAMQDALLEDGWFSLRDLVGLIGLTVVPLGLALLLLRRRKA